MDILFVGNSYTFCNEMPRLFEGIAIANGRNVHVYSVVKGGRKLFENVSVQDEVTAHLDALLNERHFDICFLQEQSILPLTDFEQFANGVVGLLKKLRGCVDRVILFCTWSRKEGSEVLQEYHWTNLSMTQDLAKAYHEVAVLTGTEKSDVGWNFYRLRQNYWDRIELYNWDLSHPSYQGSCLAALTLYQTAFGDFPDNTDALGLLQDEINAFRNIICGRED